MPKQLNVSLNFNANTSQARQAVQGLLADLNKLGATSTQSFQMDALTSDIMEAKSAAKELGLILDQSFNVDTGKLDLNKFNDSLKASGMTLTQYGNKLMALGAEGDKAFLKIAQSIIETEAPLRRSSNLLREFGTTLANTARWQISSSILHGFMGGIQKAYGYAQDLDESLNNIRIVTGQTADQMAVFAEKANKAAKALSSTTTEYTNASLIYFQQGLEGAEVDERTAITIKMAQAAGQSVEIVSDQLTSIWNNFYDGTKSLEYYADVMTALGAATASSTDEIAGGLEKFIAIGDTIGLSYEYAASALATITANTRQSEEVVGTALKTIFARIQGLELGETLDDGVNLNKYSEALAKVGISIFDSAGEMKKMDSILDEMAAKWGTLSKAQQAALAQTVAGVRQYTQLIALMDNWNNGDNDSMIANLSTSYGSTGTLQEQADIYAESWEASKDRVTASLEGIYDSLLDKDFFTSFNNGLAGFLGTIEILIDSMGGMPGILMLIGMIGTRVFEDQIANGINNVVHSVKNFTGVSMIEIKQLKKEAYEYAMAMTAGVADRPGIQAQRDHLGRVYQLQMDTEKAMRGVNAEQAKAIEKAYELAKGYSEVAVEAAAAQEKAEELNSTTQKEQSQKYGKGAQKKISDSNDIAVGLAGADLIKEAKNVENIGLDMGGAGKSVSDLRNAINDYKTVLKNTPDDQEAVVASSDRLRAAMEAVEKAAEMQGEAFSQFQSVLNTAASYVTTAEYDFHELQAQLMDTTPTTTQVTALRDLATRMQECGLPADDLVEALKQYDIAIGDGSDEAATAAALQQLGESFAKCKISTKDAEKAIKTYGISLVKNHKNSAKYRKILEQMGDKLDESVKSAKKMATATVNSANATKKAELTLKGYAESLEKVKTSAASFGSGAAKMTQGLSSIGMALSSLQGLWKTITDPDTSGFEKFLAVLTSSGMVVGSFSSGLKSLREGFNLIKVASDGTTSSLLSQAMQMKTAEIQENSWIAKIKEKIAAKQAENALSAQSVASDLAEAGSTAVAQEAQEEYNEEKEEGIVATTVSAVTSGVDAGAKGVEAAATTGAGVAQGFLNTMLAPFIALIGAALVAVLPYIAALGALAAVVGVVAYAVTAESRALEEAEAREQRAADAAKRVTEEINGIKASLDKISSKTDALKSLEQGTVDWYLALSEVNDEVQLLLNKYPELMEMGYITRDSSGLMGITQAGQDYIGNQLIQEKTTASNVQLSAQQNMIDTQMKLLQNNFSGYDQDRPYLKAAAAAYSAYGEEAFNYENIDAVGAFVKDALKEWDASWEYHLGRLIIENDDTIREYAALADRYNQLEDAKLANRMAAYGSTRSVEQSKDLMGDYNDTSISGSGNGRTLNYTDSEGNQQSFNMQKHFNYNAWGNSIPKEIQDFMSMQGTDDVEYVAQRNGKLVLKIDGEEVKFTENEVYDALGELYSGQGFEAVLKQNLQKSLGNALSGVDFSTLSLDTLIDLDNIYAGLETSMQGDADAAKSAFQNIVDAYGTSKQSLEQLANDTQYIDMTSAAFERLATNANLSGKALQDAIQEMNALGQIDSMGAFFSDQAKSLGMDESAAQDMQDYAKSLIEVADESALLDDNLKEDAESAADLAIEVTRMNKGIDTLADNFKDWNSILKKSSKTSAEYAKAMAGMKKAVADVIDVEADMISSDFITKHSKDIEKAATGDAAAIDRLRAAMDEEIIANISLGQTEEFKAQLADLDKNLKDLVPDDVQVGMVLTGADETEKAFLEAANKIVQDANMTADEANAYFAGIGYEPVYNVEEVDTSTDSPNVETVTTTTGIGINKEKSMTLDLGVLGSYDVPAPYMKTETTSTPLPPTNDGSKTRLMSMSGDGTPPKIQGMRKKATGSMNNYSSSNKGGKAPGSGGSKSSSKPKKGEKLKKSEIVERYAEITDSLTDVREEMDDVSRAADNLWGPKRWKQLEKSIELIDKEIELLKERKEQSESYLAFDKIDLDSAARKLGFTVEYGADGDVLNGTEIQEALLSQYNKMVDSMGTLDENEEEKLSNFKDNIDAFNDALSQYKSSQQEVIDDQNAIEDAIQKKFDERQTIFSEKWELKVELNDDELQRLDYYLSKTEDDFYQRAEGLAILGQQTGVYTQQLETQKAAWDELNQLKEDNLITDTYYKEKLDEIKDSLYNNLETLQEVDKQMMEYYGETLQMASDEIDKVTDQMEHHNSVLEHYLSILELMGESANYKTIGVVLEGQAEVKKNRMIAAQKEWQTFQEETDAKYLALKTATDEASAEMLKKQYEDALAISSEKQDEYLSLAAEYAESLKSILENSLAEYAQDLENALTGGTSFDQMNTKLERAAALQEEYLTTTNKIYETNKMMNTAQQELDKTTNTIAKQRLKQFIDETNQLQKKNKLSQYELDIQQAKYDLLLAEIALEEAQNTKSSVRLQRDAEGNFGYVYTADQDKIAEAQQQLADAQNSLYNIALEGSNDYFTKYQETLNEMYDTFTNLHQQYLNGEFESEQEYQNAVAEAKAYYYELLEQYSDLYTIAISADARALEDSWSKEFNSMIYNTENWQKQVDIYVKRAGDAFKTWEREMDVLTGQLGIGGSLEEVSSGVSDIVDENEKLLSTLLSPGGVFDTLQAEIALVNEVAAAYATERASVLELIKTYEALTLALVNVKRAAAGEQLLDSLDLPTNDAENQTSVPGSAKPGDGTPNVGDQVTFASGRYYYSSDGLSPTGDEHLGENVYLTSINKESWAKYPYHISTGNKLGKGDLGWLKLNQIAGYDTGGYTGAWGSYGKLAMLHEKELVLNARETENLLASMELLNNIISTIDLYAINSQFSGLLNSPMFGGISSNETLEQNVTIEANFPNVNSRIEIEEAFSTLVNRASQYANRK